MKIYQFLFYLTWAMGAIYILANRLLINKLKSIGSPLYLDYQSKSSFGRTSFVLSLIFGDYSDDSDSCSAIKKYLLFSRISFGLFSSLFLIFILALIFINEPA